GDAHRGDRRVPQPDGSAREARCAAGRARTTARPAPLVRARRRGARAAGPARARARRRDVRLRPPDARRSQPPRAAAHGLREGAALRSLGRARAVALRRGRLRGRRVMATTERDYYELLGVSRDADDGAIKKAFRRLARQLHPDVSSEPEAEQRFREVTEAYEVLSNSETRALYDRYGHAGLRSGGFQPTQFDMSGLSDLFSAFFGDDLFGRGTRRRGADVGATVEIELTEAAKGVTAKVPFDVTVACGTCSGDGVEPGTTPLNCPRCDGTG